jgi:hypothetical protein
MRSTTTFEARLAALTPEGLTKALHRTAQHIEDLAASGQLAGFDEPDDATEGGEELLAFIGEIGAESAASSDYTGATRQRLQGRGQVRIVRTWATLRDAAAKIIESISDRVMIAVPASGIAPGSAAPLAHHDEVRGCDVKVSWSDESLHLSWSCGPGVQPPDVIGFYEVGSEEPIALVTLSGAPSGDETFSVDRLGFVPTERAWRLAFINLAGYE